MVAVRSFGDSLQIRLVITKLMITLACQRFQKWICGHKR